MIRISSSIDLKNCFRDVDRDTVIIPKDFAFPMALKNVFSWIEPSGHRVYLVYADSEEPRGIVFQRTLGAADAAPTMCHWCNTVRGGTGVSLMTATASKDRRVGLHLCSQLNCVEGIEGLPGVNDLRESLSRSERTQRMMARIKEFANKNLY